MRNGRYASADHSWFPHRRLGAVPSCPANPSKDREGRPGFFVWNPGAIPEAVARQIFQRSFSTKGQKGRGLGRYSMKLFGERYLGGTVGFSGDQESGTLFWILLPPRRDAAGPLTRLQQAIPSQDRLRAAGFGPPALVLTAYPTGTDLKRRIAGPRSAGAARDSFRSAAGSARISHAKIAKRAKARADRIF